jgi:leader peptidase (prepilin peptidase)/N-methyltransferase
MEFSIILGLFILGTILGSFYNVVAYRITKGESILFPSSHCPNCNHNLRPWELIPVVSFILQKGKCSNCKTKISWFYPLAEIACGILFVLCYLSFGISKELIIALTFTSMLIIIVLSDYYYMVIEDCVLLIFGIFILIEKFILYGLDSFINSIINALIAFIIMLLLKLFGDFIFKRESLGGGDVKLMAIFGMVIGYKMSIISIFLSAFIALPTSLIILKTKSNHEIPYGPFLSLSAILIYFLHVDINMVINLILH